jgi:hypothetical protein
MRTDKDHGEIMRSPWYTRAAFVVLAALATTVASNAHIADRYLDQNKKGSTEEVQRTPTGAFDLQRNVVSNVDFYTTNYGIFGYNIASQVGGTFWPRGGNNQYLFAGGAWFAALKRPPGSTELRKRVMITYNPNSGQSWMVPGSIEDGTTVDQSAEATQKNRTYFSTDFSTADGTDFLNPTYPNWPIWDSSPSDTLRVNNYYGYYINDINNRNRTNYNKGPAFISDEDVYCIYRDTDLSRYEGGSSRRQAEGYPLGFQIEQMIYSWGFGDYADMLFIKYLFIHPPSFKDTLYDCWMAAVMDVDIAPRTNPRGGAANDRARYYNEEDSLNLAVQWTNPDRGEAGQGFGYLGFNFLESPAVDVDGFLRKDAKQFPVNEQLGLRTMRNWPITVDPIENEDRYNFMTSGARDGDDGPGDRRLLMATGPFNMRPDDSARIVVGLIMATTATGKDATGTTEDMAELLRKVRFAQFVYNNQFRAPRAPDIAIIKGYNQGSSFFQVPDAGWLPLNNAIVIQWDSTSELSIDTLEGGMDFAGYRIYRARRTDQDTFDIDFIETQRKGPLAWKQIGRFHVPSPFVKDGNNIVPNIGLPLDSLDIADIIVPGQRRFLVARRMSFAGPWSDFWTNVINARPPGYQYSTNPDGTLNLRNIDKRDSVVLTWFTTQFEDLPSVARDQTNGGTSTRPKWFVNQAQADVARDSLIKLILAKKVKEEPFRFRETEEGTGRTVLRPFFETAEVRRGIYADYMRSISRGRTFFDFGDDDGNGTVTYSADPQRSEKLINNVDYYYTVRAYDEGDYLQGTASKLTNRAVGLPNTVRAMPLASRPGEKASFEFRVPDESRSVLGGIYNLKLLVNDDQRFNQLFSGKTLEVLFYRDWFAIDHDRQPATQPIGLYSVIMFLRDSVTQDLINTWQSALPPQLCGGGGSLAGYYTENTVTWVDTAGIILDSNGFVLDTVRDPATGAIVRIDTTTFLLPNNMERVLRTGSFFTNATCLFNKYALGTIGLSFDYGIEQWGGVYRALDSGTVVQGGDPDIWVGRSFRTALTYSDNADGALKNPMPEWYEVLFPGAQPNPLNPYPQSYNNGPGMYEVSFDAGGTETLTSKFILDDRVGDETGKNPVMTFENVPFLLPRIRNVAQYDRPDLRPDGTVGTSTVSYPFDLQHQTIPFDSSSVSFFPNPEMTRMGNFTFTAFGWRNTRDSRLSNATLTRLAAGEAFGAPIGTQGRYYQSRALSTTGKDTLDFCHVFSVAGAQFTIDWSRTGRKSHPAYRAAPPDVPRLGYSVTAPSRLPVNDFKAGDKVMVYTFGGALGYPFPRAAAYAKVNEYDPEISGASYTDEQLQQVQVVPNPYYVTHEGTRSSYEGRLYFTRLPRKADIRIYTTAGELIAQYKHDETTSDDPTTFGTYVWDLLTKNNQRVASQMLVAEIQTPNGASVVRKFSIVVGPARVVQE